MAIVRAEKWWMPIRCPYCGENYTGSRTIKILKCRTEYEGDVVTKTYPGMHRHTCTKCGKMYVINFGKSTYIAYNTPLMVTCAGDVWCLAEFESEFFRNFSIVRISECLNNPDKSQMHYFILPEEDDYPIIITEEEADAFKQDLEKALTYLYRTWMTRYR
ncbi:MAG: hypothetical protein IKP28_02200 [Clostridia bacterium]|nr:hypothetical protein [Clostridia bacterium]